MTKPLYKVVVTRFVGPVYGSKQAASAALKKIRLRAGELGVVIEVPDKLKREKKQ